MDRHLVFVVLALIAVVGTSVVRAGGSSGIQDIVREFGKDGRMDQSQLQIFLGEVSKECYSAEEVLRSHSVTEAQLKNDTAAVLVQICPSVLMQATSEDCSEEHGDDHDDHHDHHDHDDHHGTGDEDPPTTAQVWGYGILAVTVVSLGSVLGAVIIPCMDTKTYRLVMNYLIGLAVSTLSANALLCLIPEAHGLHVHDYGTDVVWRNTTVLGGIYLFFCVERFLKLASLSRRKRNEKRALKKTGVFNMSAFGENGNANDCKNSPEEGAIDKSVLAENGSTAEMEKVSSYLGRGHSHADFLDENGQVAPVAFMIIFGDCLHNLIDGLAIGSSFAVSIFKGISISIAILCEEIPHELGDFAILIKSGMSVRRALAFNFISSLSCFIGLAIGIVVGQLTSAEPYIFCLAAGMFLYISLADMLPELNKVTDEEGALDKREALKIFVLQSAGILTGYGISILLSLYEDQLKSLL